MSKGKQLREGLTGACSWYAIGDHKVPHSGWMVGIRKRSKIGPSELIHRSLWKCDEFWRRALASPRSSTHNVGFLCSNRFSMRMKLSTASSPMVKNLKTIEKAWFRASPFSLTAGSGYLN